MKPPLQQRSIHTFALKVLLVDDDFDLAESMAMALARRFDVTTARDGLEALHTIERRSFDVLVVDLMMPRMDGSTLIAELAERGIRIPTILISAHADLMEHAPNDLSVDARLSKPFDLRQLRELIYQTVSGLEGLVGTQGQSTG